MANDVRMLQEKERMGDMRLRSTTRETPIEYRHVLADEKQKAQPKLFQTSAFPHHGD